MTDHPYNGQTNGATCPDDFGLCPECAQRQHDEFDAYWGEEANRADAVLARREAATIAFKLRVNALWTDANPKSRAPRLPFPEVDGPA